MNLCELCNCDCKGIGEFTHSQVKEREFRFDNQITKLKDSHIWLSLVQLGAGKGKPNLLQILLDFGRILFSFLCVFCLSATRDISHSREATRPQSSWTEKILHEYFVWLHWMDTWTLLTCCVGTLTRISWSWLRYNKKLEFSKNQSLQQLCATNQNVHWQCVTPRVLWYHSTNDAVDSRHQSEQKPFTGASHRC